MFKSKRKIFPILGFALGMLAFSPVAFGQAQQQSTTTTTTVQESSQTKAPVRSYHRRAPVAPSSAAKSSSVKSEDTTTSTSVTTTTVAAPPPPPKKEVVHKVYDEEQLKKMADKLCTDGFRAYVGTEKKNVCMSRASAPDISYTCVWDKKGTPAFAPTKQGPCNLDYTEHQGSMIIKKENSSSGVKPALPFGTEAQCCFRPAKGLETASQ